MVDRRRSPASSVPSSAAVAWPPRTSTGSVDSVNFRSRTASFSVASTGTSVRRFGVRLPRNRPFIVNRKASRFGAVHCASSDPAACDEGSTPGGFAISRWSKSDSSRRSQVRCSVPAPSNDARAPPATSPPANRARTFVTSTPSASTRTPACAVPASGRSSPSHGDSAARSALRSTLASTRAAPRRSATRAFKRTVPSAALNDSESIARSRSFHDRRPPEPAIDTRRSRHRTLCRPRHDDRP